MAIVEKKIGKIEFDFHGMKKEADVQKIMY